MRKESYRRYDYDSDVELITRTEQIEDYLDSKFSNISVDTDVVKDTIETTINNSMQDVKNGICGVNCHIENVKNEIINNMSCGVNPCVATKQDIADAVTKINAHTDEKFNEVDFLKQFSDLNEQIKNIKTTNL
jgi:hypothetical protein